jgi:hypothetical protein
VGPSIEIGTDELAFDPRFLDERIVDHAQFALDAIETTLQRCELFTMRSTRARRSSRA